MLGKFSPGLADDGWRAACPLQSGPHAMDPFEHSPAPGAGRDVPDGTGAFDLPELVQSVYGSFALEAAAKNLGLELRLSVPAPRCVGDAAGLRRVFSIILSNAVRFTDAGSVAIEVTLLDRDGASLLAIVVTDTGIGMTPETIDRLFRPLVDGAADARRDGTSLASARRLARQMEGDILIESTPGVGSRFSVEVPVAAEARNGVRSFPGVAATRDPNVLVVEDNPTNQFVFTHFLRNMGVLFDVVANGVQALEAWEAGDYDVVLMDIEMPVMDGCETTRRLRAREVELRRGPVAVIALSADATHEKRAKALGSGMNDFITKPVEMERLRAMIWRAVDPALRSRDSAAERRSA